MAMHDSHDTTRATSATSAAGTTGAASPLARLNDLDDYKVADGHPDIRGWEVKTADGRTVGKVGDLIVDTQALRVRYVDVELDRSVGELARDAVTPGDQERHTLLPIGNVELDDRHDDVLVGGYTLEQVAGFPRYSGQSITGDYETRLRERHRTPGTGVGGAVAGAAAAAGAAVSNAAHKAADAVTGHGTHDAHDRYAHADYDDARLYARRRAAAASGAADAQRLTLSEERLTIGKRQVEAGEATLRKTVETREVREEVPLVHEEVHVERRPLTGASGVDARIGEETVTVPLMAEEAVVDKRVVPVEEVVLRTEAVTEERVVDETVRKERLASEGLETRTGGAAGLAGHGGTSGAQDRATDSGLLDRAADKLDDLKDRVDGNPASRPGPDATDRRI